MSVEIKKVLTSALFDVLFRLRTCLSPRRTFRQRILPAIFATTESAKTVTLLYSAMAATSQCIKVQYFYQMSKFSQILPINPLMASSYVMEL